MLMRFPGGRIARELGTRSLAVVTKVWTTPLRITWGEKVMVSATPPQMALWLLVRALVSIPVWVLTHHVRFV
jgi:hypothetical protein